MLHRHPSQTLSFGALSGISTFATAPSSGGDAKKTDASLSICSLRLRCKYTAFRVISLRGSVFHNPVVMQACLHRLPRVYLPTPRRTMHSPQPLLYLVMANQALSRLTRYRSSLQTARRHHHLLLTRAISLLSFRLGRITLQHLLLPAPMLLLRLHHQRIRIFCVQSTFDTNRLTQQHFFFG
ncbi:hypothetical protein BD769DRAFT_1427740 [Suillus cothurnatus]|nr:hypothetical protein BD769DRAFT_1427740 [Suillus cothurnatus]